MISLRESYFVQDECNTAFSSLVNPCYRFHPYNLDQSHYNDVIMSAMVSQITCIPIICLTVCSGVHQNKYQSSALLVFVRGIHRSPVDSPHIGPVTPKMFPFDGVIMSIGLIKHYPFFPQIHEKPDDLQDGPTMGNAGFKWACCTVGYSDSKHWDMMDK